MLYTSMNHHLILYLNGYVEKHLSEKGYKSVISPGNIPLTLPGGNVKTVSPAMAVYKNNIDIPQWIIDIDIQSCGGQESFTERIQIYSEAGIKQHWMIFTKDHIVVVRKNEGGRFGKPAVYSENNMLVRGGVFPELE